VLIFAIANTIFREEVLVLVKLVLICGSKTRARDNRDKSITILENRKKLPIFAYMNKVRVKVSLCRP
jgi:hypothetical protein